MDPPDPQAPPVNQDGKVELETQVSPVSRENAEMMVPMDRQDRLERGDNLDHLVFLDPQDPLDHLDPLVHPEPAGMMDRMERQD